MNDCVNATSEQGSALAKQHHEQAQQVLREAVNMEQIRAQRAQSDPDRKQDHPDWLQVGLDGGWLPSREQKGGMEGKIGVLASQVDSVGKRSDTGWRNGGTWQHLVRPPR